MTAGSARVPVEPATALASQVPRGDHAAQQCTLAGVGRRPFFRCFPSKEDVVFPDHERCLTDMTEFLEQQSPDGDPVAHVCDAARLVLRMYAENPAFSVQRYRLTKKVPDLRAHELSVEWRYERTLAEYLHARYAARPDAESKAGTRKT